VEEGRGIGGVRGGHEEGRGIWVIAFEDSDPREDLRLLFDTYTSKALVGFRNFVRCK